MTWYRKRENPLHAPEHFRFIGRMIHRDDMPDVMKILGLYDTEDNRRALFYVESEVN
jgi:hypothetical protein